MPKAGWMSWRRGQELSCIRRPRGVAGIDRRRFMLVVAAVLDLALALLHVFAAKVGAPAYRFLRAGETMAGAAESGARWPARTTVGFASCFACASACALSAEGVLPRAPGVRPAVGLISAVFIARGLALVPQLAGRRVGTDGEPVAPRDLVFSLTSLVVGILHAGGLLVTRWQGAEARRSALSMSVHCDPLPR